MNTFNDNGKYDSDFQLRIDVKCPECGMNASVEPENRIWYPENAKLICLSCGLIKKWCENSWYGPVIGIVKRRCKYCGRRLLKKLYGPKNRYEFNLECPGCKCLMSEPVTWYPVRKGGGYDPIFGLPFWFKADFRGNEFWAYNREHLSFIKKYVAAKIRIRKPNINRSTVSRMPNWLLSNKNRNDMLKMLRKLETKNMTQMAANPAVIVPSKPELLGTSRKEGAIR